MTMTRDVFVSGLRWARVNRKIIKYKTKNKTSKNYSKICLSVWCLCQILDNLDTWVVLSKKTNSVYVKKVYCFVLFGPEFIFIYFAESYSAECSGFSSQNNFFYFFSISLNLLFISRWASILNWIFAMTTSLNRHARTFWWLYLFRWCLSLDTSATLLPCSRQWCFSVKDGLIFLFFFFWKRTIFSQWWWLG